MEPAIQQQTIKDKAPKPAGLVPKNLQAFVLVGLALLMVLIMALTGHKRRAPTANSEALTRLDATPEAIMRYGATASWFRLRKLIPD